MAGLEPLSTGMYYLDNFKMDERNLNQLSRIRGEKIGYVSQFSPMIPKLTVFENICIPHFFKKKDEIKSYTERIKFLSNKFEIYHLLDKRIEKLSGGELQRVGIARSLVNKPEIIIADEPTGSLDDETAISILNYFQEMKSLGLVIILATHNNMVAEQCDSIYQLKSEGLFITH
ncbi:hypothetical protein GCM10008986_17090 [Salinibacillus aidingensis]|uniref:ABC transporter domain-containing protein n=1 Tax=Salinibacillus aidingensis TaxID=237684 RepID=A0ABP3L3N2_9BACI